MGGFDTGMNGILLLTRAAYEQATERSEVDSDTMYIVRETSGGFSLYLGGTAMLLSMSTSAYESLTPKNPATMYVITDDTETAEEEEGSE